MRTGSEPRKVLVRYWSLSGAPSWFRIVTLLAVLIGTGGAVAARTGLVAGVVVAIAFTVVVQVVALLLVAEIVRRRAK